MLGICRQVTPYANVMKLGTVGPVGYVIALTAVGPHRLTGFGVSRHPSWVPSIDKAHRAYYTAVPATAGTHDKLMSKAMWGILCDSCCNKNSSLSTVCENRLALFENVGLEYGRLQPPFLKHSVWRNLAFLSIFIGCDCLATARHYATQTQSVYAAIYLKTILALRPVIIPEK